MGIKLTGKLVSTTNTAYAVKLGRVVNLKRLATCRGARAEIVDGHTLLTIGGELYELA